MENLGGVHLAPLASRRGQGDAHALATQKCLALGSEPSGQAVPSVDALRVERDCSVVLELHHTLWMQLPPKAWISAKYEDP
jgi:hypothetical protein